MISLLLVNVLTSQGGTSCMECVCLLVCRSALFLRLFVCVLVGWLVSQPVSFVSSFVCLCVGWLVSQPVSFVFLFVCLFTFG